MEREKKERIRQEVQEVEEEVEEVQFVRKMRLEGNNAGRYTSGTKERKQREKGIHWDPFSPPLDCTFRWRVHKAHNKKRHAARWEGCTSCQSTLKKWSARHVYTTITGFGNHKQATILNIYSSVGQLCIHTTYTNVFPMLPPPPPPTPEQSGTSAPQMRGLTAACGMVFFSAREVIC